MATPSTGIICFAAAAGAAGCLFSPLPPPKSLPVKRKGGRKRGKEAETGRRASGANSCHSLPSRPPIPLTSLITRPFLSSFPALKFCPWTIVAFPFPNRSISTIRARPSDLRVQKKCKRYLIPPYLRCSGTWLPSPSGCLQSSDRRTCKKQTKYFCYRQIIREFENFDCHLPSPGADDLEMMKGLLPGLTLLSARLVTTASDSPNRLCRS